MAFVEVENIQGLKVLVNTDHVLFLEPTKNIGYYNIIVAVFAVPTPGGAQMIQHAIQAKGTFREFKALLQGGLPPAQIVPLMKDVKEAN